MTSIASLERPQSGIEAGFFAALSTALATADVARPAPKLLLIDGGRDE